MAAAETTEILEYNFLLGTIQYLHKQLELGRWSVKCLLLLGECPFSIYCVCLLGVSRWVVKKGQHSVYVSIEWPLSL